MSTSNTAGTVRMSELGGAYGKFWNSGAYTGEAIVAPYIARAKASAYRWQGKQQQKALQEQGKLLAWNAGEAQREGREMSALRYDALGREIAAQRVQAAGSGIDMSSDVARRAETSSRKAAAQDVAKIDRSAYYRSLSYNRSAQSAFFNADTARIQGDLNAKLAKAEGNAAMITGLVKGAASFGFGMLDLYGAGGGSGGSGFGSGGLV